MRGELKKRIRTQASGSANYGSLEKPFPMTFYTAPRPRSNPTDPIPKGPKIYGIEGQATNVFIKIDGQPPLRRKLRKVNSNDVHWARDFFESFHQASMATRDDVTILSHSLCPR
jgi:hypothetical protein